MAETERTLDSLGDPRFRVYAVGDKLLVDGKFRYLFFFEADERFRGYPGPKTEWCYWSSLFFTPNGFHLIGNYWVDSLQKKEWFEQWQEIYPKTDYMLQNWNWLMPHTKEELDFILEVASPARPKIVRYYRDKRVWETFQQD